MGRLNTWRRGIRETSAIMKLPRYLLDFVIGEEGPTAVEYAVMLALIVAVCFVAINSIGNNTDETMEIVSGAITTSS
jgi:pilus assembly protein Flp/PilA